jgi:hypothetical protein
MTFQEQLDAYQSFGAGVVDLQAQVAAAVAEQDRLSGSLVESLQTVVARDKQIATLSDEISGLNERLDYKLLTGFTPGPDNTNACMVDHEVRARRVFDARRSFQTTLPDSFAGSFAASDVGRRISIQSFGAGTPARQLAYLRTVPQGHRLKWVRRHEVQDDGVTPEQFIKWQEDTRSVVDTVNAERDVPVELWGIHMAFQEDVWDDFVPPQGVWDGIAFDGYAWATDDHMRSAEEIFSADFARARELGFSRLGVAEVSNQWGVPDFGRPGEDLTAWLLEANRYFKAERLEFALYFNKHCTMSRDTEFISFGAV